MAGVLDVAVRTEFLEPRDPFLHGLLHLLGGRGCLSAAKQIRKFTHDDSSLVWYVYPARIRSALSASNPETFERNGSGHFFRELHSELTLRRHHREDLPSTLR